MEISNEIISKVILGYLSRQHLSETYDCFLREFPNLPYLSSENLQNEHFVPQLEDILLEHFTKAQNQILQNEDRIYALWKQFDIVASQLRTATLGKEKAKAFLRTRKFKNGISLKSYEELNQPKEQKVTKDQNVQTEPALDLITLYTDHEVQTTNSYVYQQPFYTPQKQDPPLFHQEEILPTSLTIGEDRVNENQNTETPAKERLKAEATKEFKSPKRKAAHPRRRSNPLDILTKKDVTVTPLKLVGDESIQNTSDTQCVSPLLPKEDFAQMLKAMFSNSSFQEKLADNINKVTSGDLTTLTDANHPKNVEKVVKQTTDELDLSELYAMLGDLNHENDDVKKKMFFPSDPNISSKNPHLQITETVVTSVEEETIEKEELLKAAEQIICDDSLQEKIESTNSLLAQQPLVASQSHIRNLNSDLGLGSSKKLPENSATGSIQSNVSSAKPPPAVVMFESQESYHNIEGSPTCNDLKTPSKTVTYINKETILAPPVIMDDVSNEQQPQLQEIENIATDALLLLSTSPAKPNATPQKEKFSFVKILAEPFKMNLSENQMFDSQPKSLSKPLTVSDSSELNQGAGSVVSCSEPLIQHQHQRPFFEKPHNELPRSLQKILPKFQSRNVQPQVSRSVMIDSVTTAPSTVNLDKNVYSQLNLKTVDKKLRQKERQQKSRQKKKKEKRQIVTRFLSFMNPDGEQPLRNPPQIPAPVVPITGTNNFFTVCKTSEKEPLKPVTEFQPQIPDANQSNVAPIEIPNTECSMSKGNSTTITNILPSFETLINVKKSNTPTKLSISTTPLNQSSITETSISSPCSKLLLAKKEEKPSIRSPFNINDTKTTVSEHEKMRLSEKESDSLKGLSKDIKKPCIVTFNASHTSQNTNEAMRKCRSIPNVQSNMCDQDAQTIGDFRIDTKSKNKKLMKVKFNFKSPKKKIEGLDTEMKNPFLEQHHREENNVSLSLLDDNDSTGRKENIQSTLELDKQQCPIQVMKDLNNDAQSVRNAPQDDYQSRTCINKSSIYSPKPIQRDIRTPTIVESGLKTSILLENNKSENSPKSPNIDHNVLTTPTDYSDEIDYSSNIVPVPRVSCDISFSLHDDNTTDASERLKELVMKLAAEESIDILKTNKVPLQENINIEQGENNRTLNTLHDDKSLDLANDLANGKRRKRKYSTGSDLSNGSTKRRKKKHRPNYDKFKNIDVQQLLSKIHSNDETIT